MTFSTYWALTRTTMNAITTAINTPPRVRLPVWLFVDELEYSNSGFPAKNFLDEALSVTPWSKILYGANSSLPGCYIILFGFSSTHTLLPCLLQGGRWENSSIEAIGGGIEVSHTPIKFMCALPIQSLVYRHIDPKYISYNPAHVRQYQWVGFIFGQR